LKQDEPSTILTLAENEINPTIYWVHLTAALTQFSTGKESADSTHQVGELLFCKSTIQRS